MSDRRILLNAGIHVYGGAAMALGLIGLAFGDFASVWQPIQTLGNVPHRAALAYLAATLLLLSGLAVQRRRTAKHGIVTLAILYFIFAMFWLPRVIGLPLVFGTWGGFLEQFALVIPAVVFYASAICAAEAWADKTAEAGRILYGICVLSFAAGHFSALPQTAQMVPAWIPPGQHFWAVATGVFHLFAGLAIVSDVVAVRAARLLSAMIIGFGVLVWAPRLFAAPHEHFAWAGNAINLALVGGAWVMADYLASRKQQASRLPDAILRPA